MNSCWGWHPNARSRGGVSLCGQTHWKQRVQISWPSAGQSELQIMHIMVSPL